MTNTDFLEEITFKLAEIGKNESFDYPHLENVKPFRDYFDKNGNLIYKDLDLLDHNLTHREVICRYLLLNAVLDQGPDVKGVRILIENVINELYKKKIPIIHRPISFFNNLNTVLEVISEQHSIVKELRSHQWAKYNESNPTKYNLFFAQSTRGIVSNTLLDYVIHRWGVPLSVPLCLENDPNFNFSKEPLVDLFESMDSSEKMSSSIKKHLKYGLGGAIGDKACHLFVKWYIHSLKLNKNKSNSWSKCSFEVPLDSNAGRVLFRTGFLTSLADINFYENNGVINKNKGKDNTHYIRVTNIRGKKVQVDIDNKITDDYVKVVIDHLKINVRTPRKFQIQIVPNSILLNSNYGIGDFDDGLMFIGTNFCLNNSNPKCTECPISKMCIGFIENRKLITDYRT